MSDRAALRHEGAEGESPERAVSADAYAACPFAIAQEYAADYFRRAEAGQEEAEIRVPLRFFPRVLHRLVGLTFGIYADGAEAGRMHDEIRVRWSAGTPFIPDFHGTVRLRIAGSSTRVLVDGTYRAPFGSFGRIFDGTIGARVARASARDLASRIAAYLEAREKDWRTRVG